MLLKDKVALVTGSGTGIGKGIALRFAREGAAVVVNSRTAANVKKTAEEIRRQGGTALEAPADVTVEAEVERVFQLILEKLGRIDILVNNAMTSNPRWSAPFLQLTSAEWDNFMKANLGSLFYCTHRAAKIMARQKIRGSIINISTNGAVRPHRGIIAYDSMKGAMDSFTRAVAVDLARAKGRASRTKSSIASSSSVRSSRARTATARRSPSAAPTRAAVAGGPRGTAYP